MVLFAGICLWLFWLYFYCSRQITQTTIFLLQTVWNKFCVCLIVFFAWPDRAIQLSQLLQIFVWLTTLFLWPLDAMMNNHPSSNCCVNFPAQLIAIILLNVIYLSSTVNCCEFLGGCEHQTNTLFPLPLFPISSRPAYKHWNQCDFHSLQSLLTVTHS